jgi:hypothetical protein
MRTRPPKYTDPAEVERICQKYLDDCKQSREENMVTLKSGAMHTYGKWPSTEGLALALGISYGHLMRLISEATDSYERERTYGESESVSLSSDLALDGDTTQDTVSLDRSSVSSTSTDKSDIDSSLDADKEYEEAQKQIRAALARVRLRIIEEITDAADSGMIDSKVVQLRLSRLGIAAKVEQDNTRKVEIVGYTPKEIGELFT